MALDVDDGVVFALAVEGVFEVVDGAGHAFADVVLDERAVVFDGDVGRLHATDLIAAVAEDLVELRVGVDESAVFDEHDADQGLAHQTTELRLRLAQRPVNRLVLS